MSSMYVLIIASLLVAIGFLIAFLWAVKSGQFEDKHTPKIRILLDEKQDKPKNGSNESPKKET